MFVVNDLGDDGDALWGGIFWSAHAPRRALFERLKSALIARAMARTRRRAEADVMAGFLLIGWGGDSEANVPEQLVSSVELRDILVEGDSDLRSEVLRHLRRWSVNSEGKWRSRLLAFLSDVWPKHRALRTPDISAELAALAMVSGELFPKVVAAILPRLVPVRSGIGDGMRGISGGQTSPAQLYPSSMVDLVWAILGEDATLWPYKVEDLLNMLSELPETRADPRLSELRRRRIR